MKISQPVSIPTHLLSSSAARKPCETKGWPEGFNLSQSLDVISLIEVNVLSEKEKLSNELSIKLLFTSTI